MKWLLCGLNRLVNARLRAENIVFGVRLNLAEDKV